MERGYITLHRKITEWEWYQDGNTFRVFVHCLLKSNHEEKKWQGHIIERGSFITSNNNLSVELGLTLQQVRTSLKKLEDSGAIVKEATTKNTIIKIPNYHDYQSSNKQKKEEPKKEQKPKEVKPKVVKKEKQLYGEFKKVELDEDQYNKALEVYGSVEILNEAIQVLDNYLEITPKKKYANHYAVLNGWVKDSLNEKYSKKQNNNLNEVDIVLEEELQKKLMADFMEIK